MLSWSLAHRGSWLSPCSGLLSRGVPLFMVANKNFLLNDDQSEFEVCVRVPEGTSLEATEIIANRIASSVLRRYRSRVDAGLGGDDPARTQNLSTVYARLKPVDDRARNGSPDGRRPRTDTAGHRCAEPAHRCAFGCDHRRAAIRTPRFSSRSAEPISSSSSSTWRPLWMPRRRSRASSTSTRR